MHEDPSTLVATLCRQYHAAGWMHGAQGGVSLRRGEEIFLPPTEIHRDRLEAAQIFTIDLSGNVLHTPSESPPEGVGPLRPGAAAPVFERIHKVGGEDAGAVIHSLSHSAVLVTMLYREQLRLTQLEALKGIANVGYHGQLCIPIVENVGHEAELADVIEAAMGASSGACAVLVRRRGLFCWGRDWLSAKAHAEGLEYLMELAVRMRQLGIDPNRAAGATLATPRVTH